MSLLDDDRPVNPAKNFIKLKNGALSYYDKEEGKDVSVPTPLKFIVLDQLSTVKGWSASEDGGMWSNEVKKVGEDTLNVRTKNGIVASGLWKDIKGDVVADGGKYHASIYIAAQGREGLEIQNISLKGAALNAWIEFAKKNNLRQNSVTLADWKQEGKAVKYMVPVFTAEPMDDAEREEAIELAKELRAYHNEYFNQKTEEAPSHPVAEKKETLLDDDGEEVDLSEIPF